MAMTEDAAMTQSASTRQEPTSTDAGVAENESVNWFLWISLAVVLAGCAFLWGWSGGGQSTRDHGTPLPIGAAVPSFSLTECQGETITRESLLGNVWVADFIFSRCPGPCPKLSARMRSLQLALAGGPENVRLVSFTLDPKTDSPATLRTYAKRFKADPSRWWFLTGTDEDEIYRLATDGFFQTAIPPSKDETIIHSNYFVIVDKLGRIRSAHDGLDPKSTKRILHDIERLLAEPDAP